MNIIKRKAAAQFKPIQTISVKDGKVEIIRKVPIKEIRHEFVLDEENDIVDDDNKFKVSWFINSMVIIHTHARRRVLYNFSI